MTEARERARARVWLICTAAGLGVLMVGLVLTGLVAKRKLVAEIEDDPRALLVNERLVTQTIDGHLEELGRELGRIARVGELTAALVAGRREDAIEELRPPLNRLRRGPLRVSRLSAYSPVGRVVVHAHDPERHGESALNERRLVFDAINTRAIVKGIDVDGGVPYVFVVTPLYKGRTFVGALEIGSPLVSALEAVRAVTGSEVAMLVGGRVVQASSDALFKTVAPRLLMEPGLGSRRQVVTLGQKTWATSLIPVRDVSGGEVLTLAIASDESGLTGVLWQSNLVTIGISAAGFLLAMGLLFTLARKLDAFYATLDRRVEARTAELRESEGRRARLEGEIAVARDIQMSLLPRTFPRRDHVEVFGTLEPAREVGGDFYDVFALDDTHVGFAVGDVSGKGVPASLHMAVTQTLIRTAARRGIGPAEVLSVVNDDLSRDNDTCMFVTIFVGVLDTATGVVTYAAAGHNPPLLRRASGAVEVVKAGGIAAGIMEDAVYETQTVTLAENDTLVMYTDGVTEATSVAETMFTEARLREEVAALGDTSCEGLVAAVMRQVQAFQEGAPPADDITLLAVRYVE